MSLTINEIFHSIQGESLWAGLPCLFVRLTGCNLRCTYCDTRYAYEEGAGMSIPEIISRIAEHACPLVEITGGEPLYQTETPLLVEKLLELGYEVLLETNGSFDISILDDRCIKIVDVKCPSSGESDKNDLKNLSRLNARDQLKFVISGGEDYAYAKHILTLLPPEIPRQQLLFSPTHGRLAPAELARWILRDTLNVRLHLQLHKFIWPHVEQGV
jgi:7-carboxy-7-deazaguanine synthase